MLTPRLLVAALTLGLAAPALAEAPKPGPGARPKKEDSLDDLLNAPAPPVDDKPATGADVRDDGPAGGDKAAGDKAAGDKAAGNKAAGDKAGGEKAAADKAATDKAGGDKAGADKAGGDKAGGDKAGGGKAGAETKPATATKPAAAATPAAAGAKPAGDPAKAAGKAAAPEPAPITDDNDTTEVAAPPAALTAVAPARRRVPGPYELGALDCRVLDGAGVERVLPRRISAGEEPDILCRVIVTQPGDIAASTHQITLSVYLGARAVYQQTRIVRMSAVGRRAFVFVVPADRVASEDAVRVTLRATLSQPARPSYRDVKFVVEPED